MKREKLKDESGHYHTATKHLECPKCHNLKAWTSRGEMQPQYTFKCTKCGNKDYSWRHK